MFVGLRPTNIPEIPDFTGLRPGAWVYEKFVIFSFESSRVRGFLTAAACKPQPLSRFFGDF